MNKSNLAHKHDSPQGEVVRFPKQERQAMSDSKFNYVIGIRSVEMHSTTKLVAITLATYADYETGICYPTIKTLMADTGLSNRVVCLHLKKLEELGFLVSKKANGCNSKYRLIAENIAKAVTQSNQLRKVTSDFDDIEAVTLMHEAVTLMTQSSDAESHKQSLTINNFKENNKYIYETQDQNPKIEDEKQKDLKPKKPKATMTSLPENFSISEQVQAWASEKGFNRLDEHLENFIGYAIANGKKYADWDAAFKNAIRGNWAKLSAVQNTKPQQNQPSAKQQRDDAWAEYYRNRENKNPQFIDVHGVTHD